MKKSKKILIVLPIVLIVLVLLLCGVYRLAYYEIFLKPAVTHSDIKSIDLETLNKIVVTHDNKTVELSPKQSEYQKIADIFNNKKVKIIDDRVYFPEASNYEFEFKTEEKDYVLYGCPDRVDGVEQLTNSVVFVMYDYTDSTMQYLYQVVTVSKSDFLKIKKIMTEIY